MTLRLIEEGAKKSSVLWLALPAGTRLAWHVWHDGAIHLVTGGDEQELPGLANTPEIEVILRSKDNGSQLVRFPATVAVLDQAEHPEVVAALAKERLNAIDSAALTARWAAGSLVVRLTPVNAG
ncbi:hypothetical protein Acor_51450 [Acrocarpospora corrugata]|uniref:Pyridoxamine 5'-phosphate oxidase putative domain-containing protein n=1 Tax=Acrocarpospora corrugata TaxID=35763 RepID=A0A5M3W457_9ACTN|nr:hypothetical protein [Acrocarpospora corrugata]GES03079.1 hypothetical protein Acor_51450 [Acrocarpospora corrugata]